MIGKIIKGKGFRGAIAYDLSKGAVIGKNMVGDTPRELASEFGTVRQLRPGYQNAVVHVSLSAVPGEKLSDEQWREIGETYMMEMGLGDNQYVITRHTDTEHEHIHIVANRIRFDGEPVNMSNDYQRNDQVMRQIERDYGLQQVAPSIECERKSVTRGELRKWVRTQEPSVRQKLQGLCAAAAQDCRSFSDYADRLENMGVEIIPTLQQEGQKLTGLQYRLDEEVMKGSDLGRAFSAAGIQKQGISYEYERDDAAIRRCLERAAHRSHEPERRGVLEQDQAARRPDRSHETGVAEFEPGNAGVSLQSDSSEPGQRGRRLPRHDRRTEQTRRSTEQELPGAEPADGRELQPTSGERGPGTQHGHPGGPTGHREPENGIGTDELEISRQFGDTDPYHRSHRQQLVDLAGFQQDHRDQQSRSSGRGRISEAVPDQSRQALERQINAMGADRYVVSIFDRDQQTARITRKWNADELVENLSWLKRQNALDRDILIRPFSDHGMIVLHGLTPESIEKMRRDGLAPAATIERSPGNFDAWLKLSDSPLDPNVRKLGGLYIQDTYGARVGTSSHLAGFVNHRAPADDRGYRPYVLAHDCPGKIPAQADKLIKAAHRLIEQDKVQLERDRRVKNLQTVQEPRYGNEHIREYQRQAQDYLKQAGKNPDWEVGDQQIGLAMLKKGQFTRQEIEQAITECSPNVKSLKTGQMEGYSKYKMEFCWELSAESARKLVKDLELRRERQRSIGLGR